MATVTMASFLLTSLAVQSEAQSTLPEGTARYDSSTSTMYLAGGSTEEMLQQATTIFANQVVVTVVMEGTGGLASVGYAIGGMLQAEGSTAIVAKGKDCISSCALAFLGAENAILFGTIWIHSPYIMTVPIMATHYDVLSVGGFGTLELTEYLMSIGYGTSLAFEITTRTAPPIYLKVTDITKITQHRFDPETATVREITKRYVLDVPVVDVRTLVSPR